jgi:hypothetical protein
MDTLRSAPPSEAPPTNRLDLARIRSRRRFLLQLAFALFVAAAVGIYELHMMFGTTFYTDEWNELAGYTWSPHALLQPDTGHNLYFSDILWNTVMAIFGAKSYLPFRVLGLGCNLFTAAALFTYGWRKLGYAAGVLLGLAVLTMGSSFQTVLWPSAALGILSIGVVVFSFLLLEHPNLWRALLVMTMLIAMLGAGAYGLLALVGVIVEVVLRRLWRYLYVPAIPTVLYLAWRVAFHAGLATAGAVGVKPVPLGNYTGAPSYVAQQLTATTAGLTGQTATMGAALTVGFVALCAWLIHRGSPDRIRMLALAAVPLSFWILLAIVRGQDAEFGAPRYVAFGALPLALLLFEAVRSQRRSNNFKYVAIAAVCFCLLSNWNQMLIAGRDFRYLGMLDLPTQTALQLSARYVPPTLAPSPTLATDLVAGPYLKVVRQFGSNAPSPAQLAAEPDAARVTADSVLIQAGAIGFSAHSPVERCQPATSNQTVTVAPGKSLTVRVIGGPTAISARRFGDEDPSQPLQSLTGPGTITALTKPDARNFSSPVPWKFSISGGQFQVCTPGSQNR